MTKVSLSALREAFIAHQQGGKLDLSSKEYSHTDEDGRDIYLVKGPSLEETTGLKKLGSGCYSTVYAIDEKRCLKVVKDEDEGYARFVREVVKKLPGNKYLPRVYYQGEWAGKTVYIIERLDETSVCYTNNPEYQALKTWQQREDWERKNQDMIDRLRDESRPRELLNKAFRQALKATDSMDTPFMQVDPELVAVAKLLKNSRCHNDIHAGNVMFRGNIPVVTDPST